MINYDEQNFLKIGAHIYSKKAQIEKIADEVCEKGFSNILFSSVGGSQAMMDPFRCWINEMSDLPVYSYLSSELIYTGMNQLMDTTLVFMASKSGDTKETVAAAQYIKANTNATIVSVIGKGNSILEELSDYSIVYEDGRPQELILYIVIGKILFNKGYFLDYPTFAKELEYLPEVLCSVRKQVDEKAIAYCQKYHNAPYHIWVASNELWPVCYAFSMCVLEESQWIRTKSVSSAEFFHGTLELIEQNVPVTLLVTEGKTREIDLRVKGFIEKYTKEANVFDCHDFVYPHISDSFRPYLTWVVMNAILQRISKNMEAITKHSLDIRRYYRTVEY